jgi:hypothetical protein
VTSVYLQTPGVSLPLACRSLLVKRSLAPFLFVVDFFLTGWDCRVRLKEACSCFVGMSEVKGLFRLQKKFESPCYNVALY